MLIQCCYNSRPTQPWMLFWSSSNVANFLAPSWHDKNLIPVFAIRAISKIKTVWCFHRLSKERTRSVAKFILRKVKIEPMRPAAFPSQVRALRGAPFGCRVFYYCLSFVFDADHYETILRQFLQIFADGAHKMATSRKNRGAYHVCIKCTRQSRKVLWVVLSSLFFTEIWKNGTRGHGLTFASAKEKYWSYPILPFEIVACTVFLTAFLEIAVYGQRMPSASSYLFMRFKVAINLQFTEKFNKFVPHSALETKLLTRQTTIPQSFKHGQIQMVMFFESVIVYHRFQLLVISDHDQVLNCRRDNCDQLPL